VKDHLFTIRTVSGLTIKVQAPDLSVAKYRAKMQGFRIVGS
jgi:hypothetical protein